MTSAPRSARARDADGPASTRVKSSTRTPCSGPAQVGAVSAMRSLKKKKAPTVQCRTVGARKRQLLPAAARQFDDGRTVGGEFVAMGLGDLLDLDEVLAVLDVLPRDGAVDEDGVA